MVELATSLGLIAGLAAAAYVARFLDPAWILSAGIAADVFSARAGQLGVPVSPSRVLIAAGSIALVLRATRGGQREFPLKARPIHLLLVAVVLWALGSAVLSGSFRDTASVWDLVDRLGVTPFWMFFVAPLAFASEHQRRILLGTLVVLGGYLGLTALFETLHVNALIWPKYILDPRVGSHVDRARGPFAEAIPNGVALFACGVASVMAMSVWKRPAVRRACAAVAGLCAAGCLFTLTREVWLGSAGGALVALAGFAELRRYLIPAIVTGAVMTLVALAVVPGFANSFHSRANDNASLWARDDTARAAINMVNTRPLLGFGWGQFVRDSPPFFRQADTHPLSGVGIPVHNVFLLTAAELGLIGVTLWALSLLLAVGAAALDPGGPPELRMWRIGLVAIAVHFLVVANFAPSTYPFPTLLVWTWAGLVGSPLTRPAPVPVRRPRRRLAVGGRQWAVGSGQ